MLVEILLHVEVFAAPLTHELLVTDVDAHMRSQLVLILETFVAILQNMHTPIKQMLFVKPLCPEYQTFTSHVKGFSPECWRKWTLRDMLRLKDLPHVSQVNGISFV